MKRIVVLLILCMLAPACFPQNYNVNRPSCQTENEVTDMTPEELANYYYNEAIKFDYGRNGEYNKHLSIGDALRNYYWCMETCLSNPGNDLPIKDIAFERIKALLEKIEITPIKKPIAHNKMGVAYQLVVTDGKDRIRWLQIEYNNGRDNVKTLVENGIVSIELVDKSIKSIDVKVCVDGDKANYATAIKHIDLKKAGEAKDVEQATAYQTPDITRKVKETESFVDKKAVADMEPYKDAMKIIEKAVRNQNVEYARKCFTNEGFVMFQKLFNEGRNYILGTPEYKYMEFDDVVICRSLPMQFNYKNNVGFIKNVVFRFDKDSHKVSSIAFRLGDISEIDILGKKSWDDHSKMVLINFLEDYQTSYALKNIEYLDKVFSDDALIVVGRVLTKRKKSDDFKMKQEVIVKYDTLCKSKFIGNLVKVFESNEFVNLRFCDTEFEKYSKDPQIYGIRVKQEYFSSSYRDEGYLFLIVDMRKKLPVIHVRTWEPDKTDKPIGFNSFIYK